MRTEKTPFLLEVAIEPQTEADGEKLESALAAMTEEDPSFAFRMDWESGQSCLEGTDERYLQNKIDALRQTYGVAINVGAPQVGYRETLGRVAEIDHSYSRTSAQGGDFARVKLCFEPGEPKSGVTAESTAPATSLPFVRGVLTGIEEAAEHGLLAGFPVTDFKVVLTELVHHNLDSTEAAFRAAGRGAFRELREKGAPKLLEPIMKVEVLAHDEYIGEVIGDLNSRCGRNLSAESRGDAQVVTAFAPLAKMFGYSNTLDSISQGRAKFTMHYDHFAPVSPPDDDPPTFTPAVGMRA